MPKSQIITQKIIEIRGHKVLLDFDLAELYNTETRILKQAVRRNSSRFPEDFMFKLMEVEINNLVSQSVIPSKSKLGGASPFAFTEQGVAMLSSVLNSKIAIAVNIQIMRIFTKVRQMLTDNTELRLDIEKIKKKLNNQDKNMEIVFRYLDELIEKKENTKPRTKIGYKISK